MPITKGTAVVTNVSPANTTGTSAATFSSGANALLLCGVVTDDNGASTSVSSIVVSGSPTYATAWQQVPTNGRSITVGFLNLELWYAVASSAITNQTVTVTISSSEQFGFIAIPYTGIDLANPIPNSAKVSTTSAVGTLTTGSIAYNGAGNSLYVGLLGAGSNNSTNVAPNASYTQDAALNDAANFWTHGLLETITGAVTSAQTVNATWSPNLGVSEAAALIGIEIKEAAAALSTDLEGYRFRNDDGSESTATWSAAQDTTVTLPKSTNTRLRMIVNTTGDEPSQSWQLEYRRVGDAIWRKVN